jgi:hypothetical protein
VPSQDDTEEGLRVRLSELFEALQVTLQSVAEKGGELTGHDLVLLMVHEQIRPSLVEEAEAARLSYAATWHLSHLTAVLLEQAAIPAQGPGSAVYRPLNLAIRRLNDELASAQQRRQYRSADELEGIVDRLALALSQRLVADLPVPLSGPLAIQLAADLPVPLSGPLATHLAADLPAPLSGPLAAQLAADLPAPLSAPLAAQLAADLPVPLSGPLAAQLVSDLPVPLSGPLAAQLVSDLPIPLSGQLVQTLPGPIAQAVVAAEGKAADDIAALAALAATPLNATIKSPADAIQFLQEVRDALNAIENDAKQIPPDLVQPTTSVVLDVFNVVGQSASIEDVNTMTGLKQEIAASLKALAPAPTAQAGGIQLCRRAEQPRRGLAGRRCSPPSGPQREPRSRSIPSRPVSEASPTPSKPGSTPRTVPARPFPETWRLRSTVRSHRCSGRRRPTAIHPLVVRGQAAIHPLAVRGRPAGIQPLAARRSCSR